jgi:hypothetical protein
MLIALDSGPLGDLINPNNPPPTQAIRAWMRNHLANGDEFLLSEIADYEVRRNEILEVLICPFGPCQSAAAIYLLDQLKASITYVPLTTPGVLLAAQIWAEHRKGKGRGHPSRSPKLDGDAILKAQCVEESKTRNEPIVIATMNLKDFLFTPTPMVTADEWNNI